MRRWQLALWVGALVIFCWQVAAETAELLGLTSERTRAALLGGMTGAGLGGGLVVLELLLLDHALIRTPLRWGLDAARGAAAGLVFGTVSLLTATAAYGWLGHAPWARGLSWGLLGLGVGLTEGFKAASMRRTVTAGLGAGTGGLAGGWVVEHGPDWAGNLSGTPAGATLVTTLGLAALGMCLGSGMALARVLARQARLIVLTSPLGKQLGLSFDVGSQGERETLGSLKATWILTGDPGITARHLELTRTGTGLAVRPLGHAPVEVSMRPVPPSALAELGDMPFRRLPEEHFTELMQDDVLRLGEGTHLHVNLERVIKLDRGQRRNPSASVLMGVTLAAALAWGQAEAAHAVTAAWRVVVQDARVQPQRDEAGRWRARTHVLVLRGDSPVEGLDALDFRVRIDGREVPVLAAGRGRESHQPICVALVVDRSGSMLSPSGGPGSPSRMQAVREAALSFVRSLGPTDKVLVASFDRRVDVEPATSARERLERSIGGIAPDRWGAGTTNLRGAVDRALEALGQHRREDPESRLALVVLTDGVHNVPGAPSQDALVRKAQALGCPLHAIAYGDPGAPRNGKQGVDAAGLRDLAARGGGLYQLAPRAESLAMAYDRILRAIRGSYGLELGLGRRDPDPYTHELSVTLVRAGATGTGYLSGGLVPPLPGSFPGRLMVWLPFALALGLTGATLPGAWRRVTQGLAPTKPPPPMREEALSLWSCDQEGAGP
ncbi:MAG: VWA domain-containing protein [Candidatus Sericytochromatia bacterium]|nr:VWA domain-containing protein [Candidatus Sericytochromatia bacterium]